MRTLYNTTQRFCYTTAMSQVGWLARPVATRRLSTDRLCELIGDIKRNKYIRVHKRYKYIRVYKRYKYIQVRK